MELKMGFFEKAYKGRRTNYVADYPKGVVVAVVNVKPSVAKLEAMFAIV